MSDVFVLISFGNSVVVKEKINELSHSSLDLIFLSIILALSNMPFQFKPIFLPVSSDEL